MRDHAADINQPGGGRAEPARTRKAKRSDASIECRYRFGGAGLPGRRRRNGRLTRAFDWAATPLGPPAAWPQSLRTAVRLLLNSRHPMFIWWGPELIQFYNDAYSRTMGPERHPGALGQPGATCWDEIWDIIGPQIELVMEGEGATWHEDQLVPVTRHGRREDVWWTYGYSPIDDETRPAGSAACWWSART